MERKLAGGERREGVCGEDVKRREKWPSDLIGGKQREVMDTDALDMENNVGITG